MYVAVCHFKERKKKNIFKNDTVFITVFLYIITFFCLIFYEIMI